MNHRLSGWHLEPDYCSARNVYTGRRSQALLGCVDCDTPGRCRESDYDASLCDRETWDAMVEIAGDSATGEPLCDECYEAREWLRIRGLKIVTTYNAEPDLLRDGDGRAYWSDGRPITPEEMASVDGRDVLAAVLDRERLHVGEVA